MDDIQATLRERGKTHGDYRENAGIAENCIRIFEGSSNWLYLTDCMKQTLRMNAHKIGRILAGNHLEPDHWKDIAGYNTLIVNQLNEPATQEQKFGAVIDDLKERGKDVYGEIAKETGLSRPEVKQRMLEAVFGMVKQPAAPVHVPTAAAPQDEGQRTDMCDGGTKRPTTFLFQTITKGMIYYYLVARSQYTESEVSHLARMPISATHAEYAALPAYYQALYNEGPSSTGRMTMAKQYQERWGK